MCYGQWKFVSTAHHLRGEYRRDVSESVSSTCGGAHIRYGLSLMRAYGAKRLVPPALGYDDM